MATSAYKDAQAQNNISRNVRQYSDLDLFFGRNVVGNDINKVTDVQAVKRSLRNLMNLNVFEKPFHPEISGGIRELLFENISPMVSAVLARKIEDVINNFEPRCRLVSVRALPDFDRNAYNVTIEFYVVNAPTELVDLSVMLERLR
jgi:phage baseplate assembly protein W